MKKILIFIDWFTPAVKAGGPISSVENMVNFLAEAFEFYIITGAKDLNSKHNLQGIVLKSKENIFLDQKKSINFANKNKIFIHVL